jgi:outer membrane protein
VKPCKCARRSSDHETYPDGVGNVECTNNIAVELIAATTQHSLSASGTAVGKVDVGSTWVLPPTLTVQYHFMPASRISPYVGAGVNASFFYGTRPAGPTVRSMSVNNSWGPAIQAGVDYNFSGHWFANFDVKQIFLNTARTSVREPRISRRKLVSIHW